MSKQLSIVLLAISLMLNLGLGFTVSALRRQLAKQSLPGQLEGKQLWGIEARDLGDQPIARRLDGSGKAVLVYWFSPTCIWCERNWENIVALSDAALQSGRFDVVWLDGGSDDLRQWASAKEVRFQVLTQPSARMIQEWRFRGTPGTYVVDESGRVIGVWDGAYRSEDWKAIGATLGVLLPAMQPVVEQNR